MDDRQLELSVGRSDPLSSDDFNFEDAHPHVGTSKGKRQKSSEGHDRHSSSSLHFPDGEEAVHRDDDNSLDEHEINRRLNEIESSFMPDPDHSHDEETRGGIDDTYAHLGASATESTKSRRAGPLVESTDDDQAYSDAYDTRNGHYTQEQDSEHGDSPTDSPSAAAAHRNAVRGKPPSGLRDILARSARPGKREDVPSEPSNHAKVPSGASGQENAKHVPAIRLGQIPEIRASQISSKAARSPPRRPMHDRHISTASSIGGRSVTSNESDATIGLHPLGALDSPSHSKRLRDLSRLPSFGSLASDVSEADDAAKENNGNRPAAHQTESRTRTIPSIEEPTDESDVNTPRAAGFAPPSSVTDTVIAQHIHNIRVPDTIAKDFHNRFNGSVSPDKRTVSGASSTRPSQNNLTLKEQNSKMDRLTKENFDLKLKIHFLDQALQNRSDEGIKDMINANVQFQTDLAKERRDNQALRRRLRDLERDLAAAQDELADDRQNRAETQLAHQQEMEIEITELREELDMLQKRLAQSTAEHRVKDAERTKMEDLIDALQNARLGDDNEGEGQTWRDLLTEEQGRREMAEDEIRRLRDEMSVMRAEKMRRNREDDRIGRSRAGIRSDETNGHNSRSSVTLVEQLRSENIGLKRDLGTQTSMLTSRNRERERLQQEIEDLKLRRMKAVNRRSFTSESIFDRSASRAHLARSPSRYSGITGHSRISDAGMDGGDQRDDLLRDENAQLRLDYQDLEKEAAAQMDFIDTLEAETRKAEAELNNAIEDLRALQKERDDALVLLDTRDGELEALTRDYRSLEEEAVTNIEAMEDDMQGLERSRSNAVSQLKIKNEEFATLQVELRALAVRIMQFEADREGSAKRIETLEQEIDDTSRELATAERKLREASDRAQRSGVQTESWQNEINFLREDQEAGRLKVGELTNALHAARQAVEDEKARSQNLQNTLNDERHQRDLIDSKANKEVQNVISDLNAENNKTKDEIRRLKRSLTSRDTEVVQNRSRLDEFEEALRAALGDLAGHHPTILQDVEQMQRELASTRRDLGAARQDIADKERLLKSRDNLLESSGLEARRLNEMLEKERVGRKQDLHNFEVSRRGSTSHLRAIANHENRAMELEAALAQAKRRATAMETRLREQIDDRNGLLMSLWHRLSGLCGPQWTDENGKLGGSSTDVDGIAAHLPQFQKNIVAAIRHIESIFSELKVRIRNAEKQMTQSVDQLNHDIKSRTARLDQLESTVVEITEVNSQLRTHIANTNAVSRSPSVLGSNAGNKLSKPHQEEITKLKNELKLAKSELKIHRAHPSSESRNLIAADPDLAHQKSRNPNRRSMLGFMSLVSGSQSSNNIDRSSTVDGDSHSSRGRMSPATFANKFLRTSSTESDDGRPRTLSLSAVHGNNGTDAAAIANKRGSVDFGPEYATGAANSSQQQQQQDRQSQAYQYRLRETERRLLAEREARLLDRDGARERLVGKTRENDELRAELARERERRAIVAGRSGDVGSGNQTTKQRPGLGDRQGSVAGVEHFASSTSSTPEPGAERHSDQGASTDGDEDGAIAAPNVDNDEDGSVPDEAGVETPRPKRNSRRVAS